MRAELEKIRVVGLGMRRQQPLPVDVDKIVGLPPEWGQRPEDEVQTDVCCANLKASPNTDLPNLAIVVRNHTLDELTPNYENREPWNDPDVLTEAAGGQHQAYGTKKARNESRKVRASRDVLFGHIYAMGGLTEEKKLALCLFLVKEHQKVQSLHQDTTWMDKMRTTRKLLARHGVHTIEDLRFISNPARDALLRLHDKEWKSTKERRNAWKSIYQTVRAAVCPKPEFGLMGIITEKYELGELGKKTATRGKSGKRRKGPIKRKPVAPRKCPSVSGHRDCTANCTSTSACRSWS